jgi:hypothetical protein
MRLRWIIPVVCLACSSQAAPTNQTAQTTAPPKLTTAQQQRLAELSKQVKQGFADKQYAAVKTALE